MCRWHWTTYDTPFEAKQDFTNEEDWLVGSKEDDEQEAAHDTQGTEHDLLWAERGDEPAVDDGAHD